MRRRSRGRGHFILFGLLAAALFILFAAITRKKAPRVPTAAERRAAYPESFCKLCLKVENRGDLTPAQVHPICAIRHERGESPRVPEDYLVTRWKSSTPISDSLHLDSLFQDCECKRCRLSA